MRRLRWIVERRFFYGVQFDQWRRFLLLIGLLQPVVGLVHFHGEKNEGGALIDSRRHPVLNLGRFQLHFHLVRSHVRRSDDQNDWTVRHLAHREDQAHRR